MPLNPTERLALQDAVRIANTILAGGGDAQSVAVKLTWLAQHLCGDDLHARYALAARMLDCADELTELRCVGHLFPQSSGNFKFL